MKLSYIGHSTFLVDTGSHRLLFDPFFTGNPSAKVAAADVRCDFILVSHGHSDHTCDVEEIARANDATLIANYEICEYYAAKGLKTSPLNPGGAADYPFGRAKLTLAFHTSSFDHLTPPLYAGTACGILVETSGKRIYFAGDTALFSDMQLIGRGGLDLALIPIGDRYTMGPADALEALNYLRPKIAVPMHYNTWPHLAQDASKFASAAAERGHHIAVLAPGTDYEF